MKENLILEDKNYISAKRASEIFGYSSDYVGQLCRAAKLECKMIGRSWFVTKESLLKYQSSIHDGDNVDPVVNPEIFITQIPTPVVEKSVVEIPKATTSPINDYRKIEVKKFTHTPKSQFISPSSKSQKNPFSKLTLASTFFIVAIFFIFQSFYPNTNIVKNISKSILSNTMVASISDISNITLKNISNSVSKYSNKISDGISQIMFEEIPSYYASVFSSSENIAKKFNGFVVARSSSSVEEDEVTKNNIHNSFSDEVTITPDTTGTSGVITPIFKKSNGDDFIYVLVPVKDSKENKN